MQCSRCDTANPPENRFCQGCGARLALSCPSCGHINPPGAVFCGACGMPTEFGHSRSSRFSPLGARRAPVARGELKQATVLFADIVSSTELVARLQPEEAMQQLKPSLNGMCDAVERFDGNVTHLLGDGIMALFGAPVARERHALLACQAALAIRDWFASRGGALAVRIGLHSGEIVSDGPTTSPRNDPGGYGLPLHLASRLPARVQPGCICLTEASYRVIRAFCDVTPLGRHTLRGVPEPVELFLLKGLKPAVASQQFREVALTSFRGRDHEVGILQRTLQEVEFRRRPRHRHHRTARYRKEPPLLRVCGMVPRAADVCV